MLKDLKISADKFFEDVLNVDLEECKEITSSRLIVAEVSVKKDKKEVKAFVGMSEATIKKISFLYMGEENLSEDNLIDFFKELSNIIVGGAKSLIEKNSESIEYTLSTPKIIGKNKSIKDIEFDEKFVYKIFNRCFFVAIKGKFN